MVSKTHWDEQFFADIYVYGEEANAFIKEKADGFTKGGKIACFAEGEGRNAVYLAKQGHDVIAYDQSEIGLEKANQLASKNGVVIKTEAIDLTKENVPANTYDGAVVVFGHVFESDQRFFMNNVIESVREGGLIIMEVYSEDQLAYKTGGPRNKQLLYDPEDLLPIFKDEAIIHFYYGEVVRNEGDKHKGLSHVIQIVARKK